MLSTVPSYSLVDIPGIIENDFLVINEELVSIDLVFWKLSVLGHVHDRLGQGQLDGFLGALLLLRLAFGG
jgi:hypothetical protein